MKKVLLLGRPNTGKSTLFNALTQTKRALVADLPGLTRDRLLGVLKLSADRSVELADVAGLESSLPELLASSSGPCGLGLLDQIAHQQKQALQGADAILLVVDGKSGLLGIDLELVQALRTLNKPFLIAVNKTEALPQEMKLCEFTSLGNVPMVAIAAAHRQGITELKAALARLLCFEANEKVNAVEANPFVEATPQRHKIVLLGRPNVGKSSFINACVRSNRLLATPIPGTTRDVISVPWRQFELIDTAGLRREAQVHDRLEKIISLKTIEAVSSADVLLLLIDATEGLTSQDIRLLRLAMRRGIRVTLGINKWDLLSPADRPAQLERINSQLSFAAHIPVVPFSAKTKLHWAKLFAALEAVLQSKVPVLSTHQLTACLREASLAHPPRVHQGRRIKLKFAHLGGNKPLTIVIHGNQLEQLTVDYKRYLCKAFQKKFNLLGLAPVLRFQTSENPYI